MQTIKYLNYDSIDDANNIITILTGCSQEKDKLYNKKNNDAYIDSNKQCNDLFLNMVKDKKLQDINTIEFEQYYYRLSDHSYVIKQFNKIKVMTWNILGFVE